MNGVSKRWAIVDWIVAGYTIWVAVMVLWRVSAIPEWPRLILMHAGILAFVFALPRRGAPWETRQLTEAWQRMLPDTLRFLRYVYPLPMMLFFFEEVRLTVNAIFPDEPYWFEPHLYAADAAVFGDLPARLMIPWVSLPITELMHAFYFSYYLILIGGVIVAWRGPRGATGVSPDRPGEGFDVFITGMTLAFMLAFIWYPWLASRGPWENPELMAEMPPFRGLLFTYLIGVIIQHGAVSGGCFPSAHVAGAWGIVFGLAWTQGHRRLAFWMGLVAAGMSFSCVYTRYHHALDIPAGFLCGVAGTIIGRLLVGAPRAVTGGSEHR